MRVALRIAFRYLYSPKKTNFIQFLSTLSIVGVAVGTMALVVVLSVFNGLEGVIRDMFGTYDPDIKVEIRRGKSFSVDSATKADIAAIQGVLVVSSVAEDNALIRYREAQVYAKVKGVEDNYRAQNRLSSAIVQGEFPFAPDAPPAAVIGRGIQYQLSANTLEPLFPIQCWYPKNRKSVSLNPTNAFNIQYIPLAGVFAIEKSIDDAYVYVPLSFATNLFGWQDRVSALEVKCTSKGTVQSVQKQIKARMGDRYKVLNSDEQHAGLIKAIRIERLFVFVTFAFVLAIASINIFFSLYMLILEKEADVAVLKSLGAEKGLIRSIFLLEGLFIGLIGAAIGLFAGYGLCLLQQQFGLVSMGMQTSLVDAYPVVMKPEDFLLSAGTILIITLMASFVPAKRAVSTPVQRFFR